MFEEELAALNTKIGTLNYFDDKDGLFPVVEWLEVNIYPLSKKYDVELAVNVYKDLYKLRIGTVVSDGLSSSVTEKTMLRSKYGRLSHIAISWHTHPESGSLGRSGFDLLMKKKMKVKYKRFQSATFWVTYEDSIKGIISNEY